MCLTKQLNPVFRIPRISVERVAPAPDNGRSVVAKAQVTGGDQYNKGDAPELCPRLTREIKTQGFLSTSTPSALSSSNVQAPKLDNKSTDTRSSDAKEDQKYRHRDFSRVLPDDGECVLDVIAHLPSSTMGPTSGTAAHGIKHQKLPVKLNAMLSDEGASHIIAWMPHGRSWRILKPKQFVKEVLPKYFDYCNYNSFIRLVNAWGFRRFSSGPDRHSYYHELFLRNLPHLHSRMRRVTGKDKKPPVDQDDEPDLYEMSRLNPLPDNADSKSSGEEPANSGTAVTSPPVSTQLNSVSSNSPKSFVLPEALNSQSDSPPAVPTSAWQNSLPSSSVASYATAFAEHLRQQQQGRVAVASSHQGTPQTITPQTWPYTQYPSVPKLTNLMNPQSMVAPVSTHSSACTSSADRFEPRAPHLCMQQILQQMDSSRLQQMLQNPFLAQFQQVTSKKQCTAPQGDNGPRMLTHGHAPKNSRGESPIMYIPVYPSTLASLSKLTGGLNTPGSDS